jgi:hypothetical protein
MTDSILVTLAHDFVGWLLIPTLAALLLLALVAVWEVGILVGEGCWGLARLRRSGQLREIERYGRLRIERVDILARIAPMLGLMGTLIPLGPGIAALSRGQFKLLADSVSIAFDTTVIGLAVGIVGFVAGRVRRRWYDALLDECEAADSMKLMAATPAAGGCFSEAANDDTSSSSPAGELRNAAVDHREAPGATALHPLSPGRP